MNRPDHTVTIESKVAFQHCDPLGVVWHGRYFEWLEAARTELFISCDLDVPQLRALHHRMFIVEAKCRYMAPLAYGDVARISAWFGALEPLIRVGYDVRDAGTGRWCARASTSLAFTDETGRLLPKTPDVIRERLPRL